MRLAPLLWLAPLAACAASQTCPETAVAPTPGTDPTAETAAATTTDARSTTAARAGLPAEVRSAQDAPRRQGAGGKAYISLLAQGENAFLGRLELAPGAAVPEHQDPTEEYIHVLSGHGTLTIDGESFPIAAGTTVFMPAGATVSYQNGDEPLVAIQVFADPGPAAKYEDWAEAEPVTE